jgi:demethylmenaquinone methyltransferase / 2-methoxy-6-polyprenyl-1,4-benzoquinol methylase
MRLLPLCQRFGGFRVNREVTDKAEGASQTSPVRGAAPAGASDRDSAARAVREMFTAIAPRYDLLNHLLSANIDKLWWRRTARSFANLLEQPGVKVLDLCCGTGDMALALRKQAPQAEITGADFSHTMLVLASKKNSQPRGIKWVEADALQLPFPDQSFDLITSAFGFRNLADYDAGLREIFRVLRPGGECGILEFSEPQGMRGKIYDVYFKSVLPRIGRLISGNSGAYSYLPASVERFPPPPEILSRMKAAGFREASWTPYTFGIAGLFRGKH